MKRFHVNLAVADLEKSTHFYSTLFGAEPTVLKSDYAKWMLEDPRINFALSSSVRHSGINHIGLQADTVEELAGIQARLADAGTDTFDQTDAECCYAKSTKTWVRDPDQVAWETFVTFDEITHYGTDAAPDDHPRDRHAAANCCDLEADEKCCA